MVQKLFILALLLPILGYSQNTVRYKVYYDKNLEQNGLKVQVDYTLKKPSDSISFYFANEDWGESNLFNALSILKKDNPDLSFETQPERNKIKVSMKKGKKVSLTYHIR